MLNHGSRRRDLDDDIGCLRSADPQGECDQCRLKYFSHDNNLLAPLISSPVPGRSVQVVKKTSGIPKEPSTKLDRWRRTQLRH